MTNAEQYRPDDVSHYPLHMVVAILPPAQCDAAIAALEASGIASRQIDAAQGTAAAQRIVAATEQGFFGRLATMLSADDQEQRRQYVDALNSGDAVLRVHLADEAQKMPVAEILGQHGGRFINYYGRWAVESIVP